MSAAQGVPGSPHSSNGCWDRLGNLFDDDPVVKPLGRPAIKVTVDPGWQDAAKVAQMVQNLDGLVLHAPSNENESPRARIARSIIAEKAAAQHHAARAQNPDGLVAESEDGNLTDPQVVSEDEVSSIADPYDPQYSDQEVSDEERVGGAGAEVADSWSGEGLEADPWGAQ